MKKNDYTLSQHWTAIFIIFLVLFACFAPPLYNLIQQKQTIAKLRLVHAELLQSKKNLELVTDEQFDLYDTSLSAEEFGETYFSKLAVRDVCTTSPSKCWKSPSYINLLKSRVLNKSEYSLVLENGMIIGIQKPDKNLVTLLVNLDGFAGQNKLGRDIFMFTIFNNSYMPTLCTADEYKNKSVKNGIHFGGVDKCGIPMDTYTYAELTDPNFEGSCSKKKIRNKSDMNRGAACSAVIFADNWVIEKHYPW